MIDRHGYATRENCFGEMPSESTYDPDYVDDPTAEEMAFGEEVEPLSVAITEPSPANIAWRKRLEAR